MNISGLAPTRLDTMVNEVYIINYAHEHTDPTWKCFGKLWCHFCN